MGLPRKTRSKNKKSKNKRSRKSQKGGLGFKENFLYKPLRFIGRATGCGPGGCIGNGFLPLCTRMLSTIEKIGLADHVGDEIPLIAIINHNLYRNNRNRCGQGEEYIRATEIGSEFTIRLLIERNIPLGLNEDMNDIHRLFFPNGHFRPMELPVFEDILAVAAMARPFRALVPPVLHAPVALGINLNTVPNSGELNLTGRNPPLANSIDFDDFRNGEEVIQIYTPTGVQIPDSVYRIPTLQAIIDADMAAGRPVLDPLTRIPLTLANIRRLTVRIDAVAPAVAIPAAALPTSRVRRRGSAAHLL
jgi:hypothetical protein